uniref:UPAR/Ly6 domain-containing protein n=1 Tax=Magallana gigas TaxID=29159 RepID=A0A8W8JP32_MAGGI
MSWFEFFSPRRGVSDSSLSFCMVSLYYPKMTDYDYQSVPGANSLAAAVTCHNCHEIHHPGSCTKTTTCQAQEQCDAFRHDGLGNRRAFAAKGDCCEHDRCNSLTPDEMTAPAPMTTFGFMTIPHNQPTTTAFHWATLGTPPPHSTQWVTLPWSGHGQPPPKK